MVMKSARNVTFSTGVIHGCTGSAVRVIRSSGLHLVDSRIRDNVGWSVVSVLENARDMEIERCRFVGNTVSGALFEVGEATQVGPSTYVWNHIRLQDSSIRNNQASRFVSDKRGVVVEDTKLVNNRWSSEAEAKPRATDKTDGNDGELKQAGLVAAASRLTRAFHPATLKGMSDPKRLLQIDNVTARSWAKAKRILDRRFGREGSFIGVEEWDEQFGKDFDGWHVSVPSEWSCAGLCCSPGSDEVMCVGSLSPPYIEQVCFRKTRGKLVLNKLSFQDCSSHDGE